MANKRLIAFGSLAAVALLLLIVVGSVVGAYNSLVVERTAVETQSKQVDVQYQRANRLLGPLGDIASQYLQNESEVQTRVAALRSGVCQTGTSLTEKDQCSVQVAETSNFVVKVVNERYPELRSIELYKNVQTVTVDTENKISTEKTRYNDLAGAYNAHQQKCCMPLLAAKLFGFHKAELIGYSDRPNQSGFGNQTL